MPDYNSLGKLFCDGLRSPTILPLEGSCPICLDAYTSSVQGTSQGHQEKVVETYCRHIFHYTCLHEWLSTGKNSCPMCRETFYNMTATPGLISHFHEIGNNTDLLESIQPSLLWGQVPHPQGYDNVSNAESAALPEQNRILMNLEHNGRIQRQRLTLIQDLIDLAQEEEELTHAEIQFHRRVLGGENELANLYRRARLESLRWQQDQVVPEIWALNAGIQELILEERQLRYAADFEEIVATSLLQYQ